MMIRPYRSFGPLELGVTSIAECEQLMGKPAKVRINRAGVEEHHYEHYIVRCDPRTRRVRECTLLPYADAMVDDIPVTWDKSFLRKLCERDGSPRNSYGFIVMMNLGIAVTGVLDDDASQLAITVFSIGDFDDIDFLPFDYLRHLAI